MHEREGRVSALTTLLSFAFLITTEEQRSAYLMALEMLGQPDEIAALTRFLVSDESSFMTGQSVVASGGRVMLPG